MKRQRICLAFLLILGLFMFSGCATDDGTIDPGTDNGLTENGNTNGNGTGTDNNGTGGTNGLGGNGNGNGTDDGILDESLDQNNNNDLNQ